MAKPLNEHLLWKGKMQQANYPLPQRKAPMILPEVNWLTGHYDNAPDLNKEMNQSYSTTSQLYWAGVEQRKIAYRAANTHSQ